MKLPERIHTRDIDEQRGNEYRAACTGRNGTGLAHGDCAGARQRPPVLAGSTEDMRAHMLPFSRDACACLYRGFALAELRLTLASVARHFGRIVPGAAGRPHQHRYADAQPLFAHAARAAVPVGACDRKDTALLL